MNQAMKAEKESTIMELAGQAKSSSVHMRDQLSTHFAMPEPTKDCEASPVLPLLDEIILSLKDCLLIQESNMVFLQNEVFPKIH